MDTFVHVSMHVVRIFSMVPCQSSVAQSSSVEGAWGRHRQPALPGELCVNVPGKPRGCVVDGKNVDMTSRGPDGRPSTCAFQQGTALPNILTHTEHQTERSSDSGSHTWTQWPGGLGKQPSQVAESGSLGGHQN